MSASLRDHDASPRFLAQTPPTAASRGGRPARHPPREHTVFFPTVRATPARQLRILGIEDQEAIRSKGVSGIDFKAGSRIGIVDFVRGDGVARASEKQRRSTTMV